MRPAAAVYDILVISLTFPLIVGSEHGKALSLGSAEGNRASAGEFQARLLMQTFLVLVQFSLFFF